jgi:hypothetical protein
MRNRVFLTYENFCKLKQVLRKQTKTGKTENYYIAASLLHPYPAHFNVFKIKFSVEGNDSEAITSS